MNLPQKFATFVADHPHISGVSRLSAHPPAIHHPLEAQPTKSKVSLIYCTSTALDSSDYYVIDAYKSVTLLQNSKGAKEGDVWTVWVARSSFSPLLS